jgi:hypothetical protein
MRWHILWAAILALSCTDVRAEETLESQALRGLKNVHLIVEDISANNTACGLDEQTIKNAVAYPLANSRLKIGTREINPTLYVRVTSIHAKELAICTSYIDLKVSVYHLVPIKDTQNNAFAEIILWYEGKLILSSKNLHREQVRSVLDEKTKKLVVDWTAAQR